MYILGLHVFQDFEYLGPNVPQVSLNDLTLNHYLGLTRPQKQKIIQIGYKVKSIPVQTGKGSIKKSFDKNSLY